MATTVHNHCRCQIKCSVNYDQFEIDSGKKMTISGPISTIWYKGTSAYMKEPPPRHLKIEKTDTSIYVSEFKFEDAEKLDGTGLSTDIGEGPIEIHNMLPARLKVADGSANGCFILPSGKKAWVNNPNLAVDYREEPLYCTNEDMYEFETIFSVNEPNSERAHLDVENHTLSFW